MFCAALNSGILFETKEKENSRVLISLRGLLSPALGWSPSLDLTEAGGVSGPPVLLVPQTKPGIINCRMSIVSYLLLQAMANFRGTLNSSSFVQL